MMRTTGGNCSRFEELPKAFSNEGLAGLVNTLELFFVELPHQNDEGNAAPPHPASQEVWLVPSGSSNTRSPALMSETELVFVDGVLDVRPCCPGSAPIMMMLPVLLTTAGAQVARFAVAFRYAYAAGRAGHAVR